MQKQSKKKNFKKQKKKFINLEMMLKKKIEKEEMNYKNMKEE